MTNPSPSLADRRLRRSEFPYEAASLFLRGLQRRLGLGSLVLGDEDGLVIAGTGTTASLERLAAWGALSATHQDDLRKQVEAFCPDLPFFSLRVAIGDTRLRLSGVAGSAPARGDIEPGLARILGERLGMPPS